MSTDITVRDVGVAAGKFVVYHAAFGAMCLFLPQWLLFVPMALAVYGVSSSSWLRRSRMRTAASLSYIALRCVLDSFLFIAAIPIGVVIGVTLFGYNHLSPVYGVVILSIQAAVVVDVVMIFKYVWDIWRQKNDEE